MIESLSPATLGWPPWPPSTKAREDRLAPLDEEQERAASLPPRGPHAGMGMGRSTGQRNPDSSPPSSGSINEFYGDVVQEITPWQPPPPSSPSPPRFPNPKRHPRSVLTRRPSTTCLGSRREIGRRRARPAGSPCVEQEIQVRVDFFSCGGFTDQHSHDQIGCRLRVLMNRSQGLKKLFPVGKKVEGSRCSSGEISRDPSVKADLRTRREAMTTDQPCGGLTDPMWSHSTTLPPKYVTLCAVAGSPVWECDEDHLQLRTARHTIPMTLACCVLREKNRSGPNRTNLSVRSLDL